MSGHHPAVLWCFISRSCCLVLSALQHCEISLHRSHGSAGLVGRQPHRFSPQITAHSLLVRPQLCPPYTWWVTSTVLDLTAVFGALQVRSFPGRSQSRTGCCKVRSLAGVFPCCCPHITGSGNMISPCALLSHAVVLKMNKLVTMFMDVRHFREKLAISRAFFYSLLILRVLCAWLSWALRSCSGFHKRDYTLVNSRLPVLFVPQKNKTRCFWCKKLICAHYLYSPLLKKDDLPLTYLPQPEEGRKSCGVGRRKGKRRILLGKRVGKDMYFGIEIL